jgi:mannobiose 2-epimerase
MECQAIGSALTEGIIPFWRALRDEQHGGYHGYVDAGGAVDSVANKGAILTSRILWFFSTASAHFGQDDLLEDARHAYRFLTRHLIDPDWGGVYWSVRHDGAPADPSKHTYAQAFAIYGLACFYRASGERAALDAARALFDLIENRCADSLGYVEASDRFFRPVTNDKLSENGFQAARTMNTLLHIFEAYAELYSAWPDERVEAAMRRLLDIFATRIYNPARHRLEVFFDAAMRPIGDIHSFGHDIEASWLLDWGTATLGDPALSASVGAWTQDLATEVLRSGYHGGALDFETVDGVVDRSRVWWVHAEAMLGFHHAHLKDPTEAAFAAAPGEIWDFITGHLIDPRPDSEWLWEVDDAGRPNLAKPLVSDWKCPYHNGRMCLNLMAAEAVPA